MSKASKSATSAVELGCECGFRCMTGKELYHHRKRTHGDDGSVAFAYVGGQVFRQNHLKRAAADACVEKRKEEGLVPSP